MCRCLQSNIHQVKRHNCSAIEWRQNVEKESDAEEMPNWMKVKYTTTFAPIHPSIHPSITRWAGHNAHRKSPVATSIFVLWFFILYLYYALNIYTLSYLTCPYCRAVCGFALIRAPYRSRAFLPAISLLLLLVGFRSLIWPPKIACTKLFTAISVWIGIYITGTDELGFSCLFTGWHDRHLLGKHYSEVFCGNFSFATSGHP